jgi:predicted nucleic acid-binding Zn ribbon protein
MEVKKPMNQIEIIRYCQDEKYRQQVVQGMRHDLAVKFRECRKRVKANKAKNGGIYIPEN